MPNPELQSLFSAHEQLVADMLDKHLLCEGEPGVLRLVKLVLSGVAHRRLVARLLAEQLEQTCRLEVAAADDERGRSRL